MKKITLTLLTLIASFASFAIDPIIGINGTCVGATTTLADSTLGGTWSSSNTSVATVTPFGMMYASVSGVSAGTAIISYVLGSDVETMVFTVSAPPSSTISGPSSICIGSTATYTNSVPGGVWSTMIGRATIDASTGVATGVTAGFERISYHTGPGCLAERTATVTAGTVGYVLGDSSVCEGSTLTLSHTTSGGIWTSSMPSIASIGSSSGVVTGISAGSALMSYAYTGTCGLAYSTRIMRVSAGATSAGTLSGLSTVAVFSSILLSSSVSGGTRSSSSPSVATITSGGNVDGVSAGTTTITYTVTGCSGSVSATTVITVTPFSEISGHISFPSGGVDTALGYVKVWLIRYNSTAHLLEAVDSTYAWDMGLGYNYRFVGHGADSFRVKAHYNKLPVPSSGYVPTYHTSSLNWNTADVFYHTGATTTGIDITMLSGTPTAGPGFIGGDVFTGANKGTSGGVPAVRMLMYLMNESTGQLVQQTYTDAAGSFSFSGLPVGVTYKVYPEAINYATTPLGSVNLTSGTPAMSAAHFIQHTVSMTITPGSLGVDNVSSTAASFNTFPNPASGKLSISWNGTVAENGSLTVTDVAGRVVYTSAIALTKGAGYKTIDLSSLSTGSYIVIIRSASVGYTGSVQIAR